MMLGKPYTLNRALIVLQTIMIIAALFSAGDGIIGFGAEKLALVGLISLINFLLRSRIVPKNSAFKIYLLFYGCVFFYLLYSYYSSYSREATQPYILRFIVIFVLLLLSYDVEYLKKICNYCQIVTVVIAGLYIITWPIQGNNAGIYQSYQNTAIILSMGSGFTIPLIFEAGGMNRRNILSLGLIFLAILITGKRTLFVIPIAMIFIIVLLSDDYKKYSKLCIIGLIGLFGLGVVSFVMPSALNTITRLIETTQDTSLNSRTYFWDYALMLWSQKPLFGIGFGCFPTHIATGGVNLAEFNYIRAYAAHNIYYQMLAEIGIVGITLFIMLFIIGIIFTLNTIKTAKKNNLHYIQRLALIAFYCQLWFLIYGITGNSLYMPGQLFAYFFGIIIVISIKRYFFKNDIEIYKWKRQHT